MTSNRTAGTRAVIWSVDRASQSRMAAWMVVRSVYSCIVTLGVNIRICRDSGAFMVQGHPWLSASASVDDWRCRELVVAGVMSHLGARPLARGSYSAVALPLLPTWCSTR